MRAILESLSDQPIVLLFLLIAIGSYSGQFRVAGVPIGPVAVLFAGVALSSIGVAYDVPLVLPDLVGTLGLVLFTYTVGLISGPGFFSALRQGWLSAVATAGVLIAVACLTGFVGQAMGLSADTAAGVFTGALTCTPALAAASEAAGDGASATVGYSLAYPGGVVVMLGAAGLLVRRRPTRTPDGQSERLLSANLAAVSTPGGAPGVLPPNRVASDHPSIGAQTITLSDHRLAGRRLEDLQLEERFGARVLRLRRGDADAPVSDTTVVHLGDRLRVLVAPEQVTAISAYLGASDRGLFDLNPLGFAAGLAAGMVMGLVTLPIPGIRLELGMAAGTLISGLIFGRFGRIGRLVTSVPHASAHVLSTFGMLAFLGYAGSKAGTSFVTAVTSATGARCLLLGLIATLATAVGLICVSGRAGRALPERLAGILAGAQTQPAVLAAANERTRFDSRVSMGYALVYPVAMVVKILLAQFIVLL